MTQGHRKRRYLSQYVAVRWEPEAGSGGINQERPSQPFREELAGMMMLAQGKKNAR